MNAADITALINTLSEKLGPLGHHVWGAYVRQQYVIAYQEIAMGALLLLVVGGCAGTAKTMYAMRDSEDSRDSEDAFVWFVAAIVVGIAALIVIVGLTISVAGHLANPDYYAVQGLLGR